MNMNKYLSCATCVYSHFNNIDSDSFEITNGACNDCENYNSYQHDKLTAKERFKQEKGEIMKQENIDFETWFKRLKLIINTSEYTNITDDSKDNWKYYYNVGFTPDETYYEIIMKATMKEKNNENCNHR